MTEPVRSSLDRDGMRQDRRRERVAEVVVPNAFCVGSDRSCAPPDAEAVPTERPPVGHVQQELMLADVMLGEVCCDRLPDELRHRDGPDTSSTSSVERNSADPWQVSAAADRS